MSKKKPQFKSKPKDAKEFTAKQVKQISFRATENVLLSVIAILADKHKWSLDKIECFTKDVLFAINSIKSDDLNRTEIFDIIESHIGVDVRSECNGF